MRRGHIGCFPAEDIGVTEKLVGPGLCGMRGAGFFWRDWRGGRRGDREPGNMAFLSGFRFTDHSEEPKRQVSSPWQNNKEAH